MQNTATALSPQFATHLAPLVPAAVGETQACVSWPLLALTGGFVVVLFHLELLLWRNLFYSHRDTWRAAARRGAA